jgi:hypothetical protein
VGGSGTVPGAAGNTLKDTEPGGIYVAGGKLTIHG